jgi:rSAM/selenodomain-associated transferase 2
MTLSVVIPVLDEAATIGPALEALALLRHDGAQLTVVDGGSRDGTPDLARPFADRVIAAPRGRAAQMNAGAAIATGGVLLFLHADTRLPVGADRAISDALASGALWGRFDVSIPGGAAFGLIAAMMNLRSRITGIATGDQALFVRRDIFEAVGGFPPIALMEDVALSAKLRRLARPACLRTRVTTSGRRWQQHGIACTMLLMWRLRLAYFFGADPASLARRYGYVPR